MNVSQDVEVFTEIFPVRTSEIPRLFGYTLQIKGGDFSTIGGKLSYRLKKKFPGHWVWTGGKLLTDAPQDITELMKVVEELWHEQPDVFRSLYEVNQDSATQPTPQMVADFVARGLFTDIDGQIRKLLSSKVHDLGNARIERAYETRGWVIEGKPAVSISVSSHVVPKQDLKTYFATSCREPEDLVGLYVRDKTSTLKGEVVDYVGKMKDHRARLLAYTQRDEVENAPDDEPVISVSTGRQSYDYPISALQIIVRTMDYSRFGINSGQALKLLRIEPGQRSRFVSEISAIVKQSKFIIDAYNTRGNQSQFINGKDVGFEPRLGFGGRRIEEYHEKNILNHLYSYGLYRRSDDFKDDTPIRIGIINALNSAEPGSFWSQIGSELRRLHFPTQVVKTERVRSISRSVLEESIERLQEAKPHILVTFLPDENDEDEDEWGAYHLFKSLTVSRGIASQVVYESTLSRQFAVANIVLGILGKTGNIPFVLAEPLSYADLIVGIDIARIRKRRLSGTMNATAITRIYFSSGEFLRYVIHDAPLEGETIPANFLQGLFPSNEFRGKRVVIHRDGYFRGDEKRVLLDWAQQIGAKFNLVEVIKEGSPRLYAASSGRISQPPKGSAFKISGTEALLVSSLPPFTNATPKPLRVRTEAPFTIEQAIHSILSMTLLHYGSLRPPRLPVTIHYSDRIAYLALKGIKPRDLEGNVPFWL